MVKSITTRISVTVLALVATAVTLAAGVAIATGSSEQDLTTAFAPKPIKAGRTTISVPGIRTAPDLVKRDFFATGPNRLWVADMERHEALPDRAEVKYLRGPPVAAGGNKLGAA